MRASPWLQGPLLGGLSHCVRHTEAGGWGPWTRAKPAAAQVLAGGREACRGTARDPEEAGSRVRSLVGTESNAGVRPSGPAGSLRRGFRSKGRDRHVAATRPAEVAATV